MENINGFKQEGGSYLPSVPTNYCKIIYENITTNTNFYLNKYNIIIQNRSGTKTEMIGTIKRETYLFTSYNYPQYLFMMTTDYNKDFRDTSWGIKQSLAYKNTSNIGAYELQYISDVLQYFNNNLYGSQYINHTSENTSNPTVDLINLALLNNLNQTMTKNQSHLLLSTLLKSTDIPDVGQDHKLQKDVTNYFHQKIIKWLTKSHEFNKLKHHLKFFKSNKGSSTTHKLLRLYVKKFNKNWYELRDDANYDDVKEYIRTKLMTF